MVDTYPWECFEEGVYIDIVDKNGSESRERAILIMKEVYGYPAMYGHWVNRKERGCLFTQMY